MKTRDEDQKGMMVTFTVIASTIAFSAALRFFDGGIGYPNCLSNLPSWQPASDMGSAAL